jgi:hypothetical protein
VQPNGLQHNPLIKLPHPHMVGAGGLKVMGNKLEHDNDGGKSKEEGNRGILYFPLSSLL